jgi:hypothetical protein
MPKDCPECKLVNPDSAVECDCGFRFDGAPRRVPLSHDTFGQRRPGRLASKPVQRVVGLLFFLSGVGVTILAWQTASTKRYSYVIAMAMPAFAVMGLGMLFFPMDREKCSPDMVSKNRKLSATCRPCGVF